MAPRILILRLACSITASTCSRAPDRVTVSKKSQASRAPARERRKPAHVAELRPGAGPVPASCRISQTVEAATFTPGTSSSPRTRRYPDPGFSRTSRNTRTRIERTVRGRPGCRGRDRRACRRAATWRCQRSTVSGRTTKCSRLSTSIGSRCSSAASNARSPGVNRTLSGPSCRCRTEKLVAQREDLRVFVPAAHRQQPRREHVRHTKIGQPQQHGRSPCHNNPPSHERPTGRHRAQHRPHPCIGSTSMDEVSGMSKAGVGQQPPVPSPSPATTPTIYPRGYNMRNGGVVPRVRRRTGGWRG